MSIAKQLRKGVFYRVDDNQIVDIQVTEELMKNAAFFIDQIISERDALKARIDELESNLKLSRTRLHMANAKNNNLKLTIRNQANSIDNLLRYKARIDGGIRCFAYKDDLELSGVNAESFGHTHVTNATLILDEWIEL